MAVLKVLTFAPPTVSAASNPDPDATAEPPRRAVKRCIAELRTLLARWPDCLSDVERLDARVRAIPRGAFAAGPAV